MQEANDLKEIVLNLFEYKDGNLWWKEIKHGRASDRPAGHINGRGYRILSIWNKETKKYKIYSVHRLVFLIHHGYLPNTIDHIDGEKDNNRIENLRDVTLSQNQFNRKINKTSTTGVKGVKWSDKRQRFLARLKMNNKEYHIGTFKEIEAAAKAIKEFRENYQGEFARHK